MNTAYNSFEAFMLFYSFPRIPKLIYNLFAKKAYKGILTLAMQRMFTIEHRASMRNKNYSIDTHVCTNFVPIFNNNNDILAMF